MKNSVDGQDKRGRNNGWHQAFSQAADELARTIHRGDALMSVSRLYVMAAGILLIGYAIFDKGFAYLGYAPVYIGELFLGFSLLVLFMGGFSTRVFGSPIVWALVAFMIWGAARTIPYLESDGLNAVRDSVIWMYGVYAFLIAGALMRGRLIGSVPRWYRAWFPWFLLLAPFLFVVARKFPGQVPTYPWSGQPVILMKPGDMLVHLAGIAGFLSLGLHRQFSKPGQGFVQIKEFAFWIMWGAGVIVAGARNRGGLLAVLIACGVILMFKPASRLNRIFLPLLLIVTLMVTFDIRMPIGGGRDISVQQIVDNVESIFFKSKQAQLADTTSWRLLWWEKIRDETIFGEHFWSGRGFGTNIAETHAFSDDTGNRSPHNGHLTILSRSGVPGLIIWLIFLGIIGFSLLQGYFRMRALGQDTLANLNLWTFTYWLAFLINATFDVYLEGPQGGIWFWCVTGFAIALTQEQRQLYSQTISKQQFAPRVSMGKLQ